MNMKRREKWSCGRRNRKFRGENQNAEGGCPRDTSDPIDSNRLDVLPRHTLRQIFRREIEQGIEDAMDHSGSDWRRLFARVDPEYAMKIEDRVVFAKACDCGSVTVDRRGHVHHHLLSSSIRRKRHEERVARRERDLQEIAS